MNIHDCVKNYMKNVEDNVRQKQRKEKLNIYCEGLKSKATQVNFSVKELIKLKDQTDTHATASDPEYVSVTNRVAFYCDSFWIFLYSCLDILGQIVNQSMDLKFAEKKTSFKGIKEYLDKHHKDTQIQKNFAKCFNSREFKNLDHYRNCSIHRRHIYFEEQLMTTHHQPGYSVTTSTSNTTTVVRTICDNPLDLKPKTKQKRKVPEYLEKNRDKISLYIIKIIKSKEINK